MGPLLFTYVIHFIIAQEGEQARLVRIQQRDEAVTEFDKRVRPYIDALLQEDSGTKSQTENATGATQH